MTATTGRLCALAEGPALDLPPVRWVAPTGMGHLPFVRWGVPPWESANGDRVPNVYLCAYDVRGLDGPFIDVGSMRLTPAESRVMLDRLASAIAMAEELTR